MSKQIEMPTINNTVHHESQVKEIEPKYAKFGAIGKLFGISRSSVSAYTKEMEDDQKFKDYVLDISYGLKLVNIAGFEQFLKSKNKCWYTE